MNSISHEKAREYLHLSRESLEADHRQALEAHLFVCEDCHTYSRDLAGLERELKRSFHNWLDPVPIPVGIAGEILPHLKRDRGKWRESILAVRLIAGLALLLLFAFLIESFGSSLLPSGSPSPVATGTEQVKALTAVVVGAGSVNENLPAAVPGGRWIAFTSRRDGNEEIYRMNAGGRELKNLTDHPAADYLPAWSPDGQRLAFVTERTGKPEVYRMESNGSGLVQLTDLPYAEAFWALTWSPDGTRLAAEVLLRYSVTGELFGRIFLIQADGSGIQDLTRNELPLRASNPQWSPTGDWITYVRCGQAPCYLRNVHPDATGDAQVNLSVRNTRAYGWSPDGSQLAYITSCAYCELYDDDPADLRLMEPGGSEPEVRYRFEHLSLDYFNLSWSPDGAYLAFTANLGVDSVRHLFLLPAAGGDLVDVAAFEPGDWFLSFLSWSPDSKRLVLDGGVVAERDIFLIDLEARLQGGVGEGVTNLTPGTPGMDYQPQWQP